MTGLALVAATGLATAATDHTRWTTDTLPVVAVHVTDADGVPMPGLRVELGGEGSPRTQTTGKSGSAVHTFVQPSSWVVSVYAHGQLVHQMWLDLPPRHRADVVVHLDPLRPLEEPRVHAPPVVDPTTASRGSVFRGGRLARLPIAAGAGGG